jgi:hypothetical protein
MLSCGYTHDALETSTDLSMTKNIVTSVGIISKEQGIQMYLPSRSSWLFNEPKIVLGQLLAPLNGLVNVPY